MSWSRKGGEEIQRNAQIITCANPTSVSNASFELSLSTPPNQQTSAARSYKALQAFSRLLPTLKYT